MISSAVAFKLLAAALAFVNVAVATAILPTFEAVAYLAAISFAQLAQPLAGFGLVTRLVAVADRSQLAGLSHRKFFVTYAVLAAGVGATISAVQGASTEIVAFAALMTIQAVEAERVRAAYAEHSGIYLQNSAVFVSALSIWVFREFTLFPVLAMAAVVMVFQLLVPERRDEGLLRATSMRSLKPQFADVAKGVRAMTVNQFYNGVVVAAAVVLPDTDALLVTLVYRTGLFFNWQIFYWMRYGHKKALEAKTQANSGINRRLGRLSLASFIAAALVATVLNRTDLLTDLAARVDEVDVVLFSTLVAFYGFVQFLFSRTFPYEATIVYLTSVSADVLYVSLLGFLVVCFLGVISLSPGVWVVLVSVEAIRAVFRLVSWRQSRHVQAIPARS